MAIGPNWRDDAACLHADTDLFFPVSTAGPAMDEINEASPTPAP